MTTWAMALLLSVLSFSFDSKGDPLESWSLLHKWDGGAIAASSDRLVRLESYRKIEWSTNGTEWTGTQGAADLGSRFYSVEFKDIASGNNVLVGVGSLDYDGLILVSTNAVTWKTRLRLLNSGPLTRVTFQDGQFIALGAAGLKAFSVDGATWEVRQNESNGVFYDITHGADKFVAVGSTGASISSDGISWSLSSANVQAIRVTYGNGVFVAVGTGGNYWLSANGLDWSAGQMNLESNAAPRSVSFLGNRFVYVGSLANQSGLYGALLLSSIDGDSWIHHPTFFDRPLHGATLWNNSIVISGGDCVARSKPLVGDDFGPTFLEAPTNRIVVSRSFTRLAATVASIPPSQIQWYHDSSPIAGATNGTLDLYPAVADGGSYRAVATWESTSSTSSTAQLTVVGKPEPVYPYRIPTTGWSNLVVSVPAKGSSELSIQWKTNGIAIPGETNSSLSIDPLPQAESILIQAIVSSPEGTVATQPTFAYREPYNQAPPFNWTDTTPPGLEAAISPYYPEQFGYGGLSSIAFGEGRFVAVGYIAMSDFGVILTSVDGSNWRYGQVVDQTLLSLGHVVYGNGVFVAGGWVSSLYYSTNGVDWSGVNLGVGSLGTYVSRLGFANGAFGAYLSTGQKFRSVDGKNWSPSTEIVAPSTATASGGGIHAKLTNSVSGKPGIHVSTNGINWNLGTVSDQTLRSIAFGNGVFIAVGDKGTILKSAPLARLEIADSEDQSLKVFGLLNRSYVVESSTNLDSIANWTPSVPRLLTNNPMLWPILPPTTNANRFYRAVLQP